MDENPINKAENENNDMGIEYIFNEGPLDDKSIIYEILDEKDTLIENLRDINLSLIKTLSKSCRKIDDSNHSINNILSKVSTKYDIEYIMSSQKNLLNKVDYLEEANKTLHDKIFYIETLKKNQQQFLEKKLKDFEDIFKCKICMTNNINVLLMPCFHIYM